jgi:hypothetical protein
MPVIVLFPDDIKAEDEASLLAEFQAYKEVNPDSQLSFYEWLELRNGI